MACADDNRIVNLGAVRQSIFPMTCGQIFLGKGNLPYRISPKK
jgi:hypothetical protein